MSSFIQYETSLARLVAIGGGNIPISITQKILDLSKGIESKIIVCPLASQEVDTGEYIVHHRFIKPHGVKNIRVLDFLDADYYENGYCDKLQYVKEMREKANSHEYVRELDNCDIFYFSGGDQRIILQTLKDTLFEKVLLDYWRQGRILIAGTSAGLQVQSELAFTGDFNFPKVTYNPGYKDDTPCWLISKGVVELVSGFGLLKNVILDQHFIVRRRQNRLFSALLDYPNFIGIGVDESTAIVACGKSGELTRPYVVGDSCVLVVDPSQSTRRYDDKGHIISATHMNVGLIWEGGEFPFDIRLG